MAELLFLSDSDIAKCDLDMGEVIQIMHEAYRCKGLGGVQMPPKPGVHPTASSHVHAMPAYISEPKALGIKWIGTFPENRDKGIPTISGLIVLNDPETGQPLCVMDCRRITALRTGAKTALAGRYLAKQSSETVGIIGCGVQGRSNLQALTSEFKVKLVHAYDLDESAAHRFAEDHSTKDLEIRVVDSPEEAVRDMDIAVTTSPIRLEPTPTIPLNWLKPGGFFAPVDYDSSFTGEAIQAMDLFVTDDTAQFEYHRSISYFKQAPPPEKVLDLGSIIATSQPQRTDDTQRTMAMCLGLGMDDVAVAHKLFQHAIKHQIGTLVNL